MALAKGCAHLTVASSGWEIQNQNQKNRQTIMPTQTVSRAEIEEVITRNLKYPEYRALFLKSPKTMIEKQLNNSLPSDLEIKIVEEGPKTLYFVLPYQVASGSELSDADLEQVAGGKNDNFSCNVQGAGVMNTKVSFKPSAMM